MSAALFNAWVANGAVEVFDEDRERGEGDEEDQEDEIDEEIEDAEVRTVSAPERTLLIICSLLRVLFLKMNITVVHQRMIKTLTALM